MISNSEEMCLISFILLLFFYYYSYQLLQSYLISSMLHMLITLLLVYFILSAIFFIFPTLIWKKKKYNNQLFSKILSSNKILRVAHRGGPRYTTQNTIQAFDKIQKIVDCIQMDVCQTADKILVVHHDHHLKRTCGVDKDVQNFNYCELPCFVEEIVLDFGVKRTIKSKKQKIPKLCDVFEKYPKLNFNIQLKTPTQTAIVEFVRQIHEYNRKQITIIGIRSNKNFQLKKKHPQILNFMNDKKVFSLAIAYFIGFLPFLKIDQASLQIPVYSTEYQEWNVGRTIEKDKWKIKLYMNTIKLLNLLTRPLIWHLKRRGVLSIGWVCNTQQSFDNALRAGFQGIMTDDPFLLNEYLKERNLLAE